MKTKPALRWAYLKSRPRALRLAAAALVATAMFALAAGVLCEFGVSGLARKTFVFYDVSSGRSIVEERMIRRSGSLERDVARYVEEALVGPASPGFAPLLPRGTRLLSLLHRDGTVFADVSGDALAQSEEGRGAFEGFRTLRSGLGRNFPEIREARFFVDGRAAFASGFRDGP